MVLTKRHMIDWIMKVEDELGNSNLELDLYTVKHLEALERWRIKRIYWMMKKLVLSLPKSLREVLL